MSWKSVQTLCIVLLLATVAYLYIDNRHRVETLKRRISALEAQNTTLRDEHSTRIARQRAHEARPNADGSRPPTESSTVPLRNLMQDVLTKSTAGGGSKVTPLDEFRAAVKLDESQERWVRSILEDFAQAPGQAFAQAQAEKRFIFDAKTVEMVNDARRIALERLQAVLTREQYATMMADGHDEKLGLRLSPPVR